VTFVIAPHLQADGDPALLRIVLANLIGNAWKFTSGTVSAEIHFGATPGKPDEFFVRDNGAGFEAASASRLFQPFQRFHSQSEFPGHGVGLATVRRIVQKHGGKIRAESTPNQGAGFYFTLSS
jgi:signal transduction histidine kinase